MSEVPSAQILRDASAPLEAVAVDGRRIALRRMNVLDRLRLFKAVGPELANNDAYLGVAFLACAAMAIDGVPVPTPVNENQIEALVGRLGDDGIDAVARVFAALETERADITPGN